MPSKGAYFHHLEYIRLRDLLNSDEIRKKAEQEKKDLIVADEKRQQQIIIVSVIAGLVLVLVFAGFIFRSLNITRKQKILIELKNKETEEQKREIEEKQKEIIDSITYAHRIQRALITNENYITKELNRLQPKL